MHIYSCHNAVLLLFFNRYDTTLQVLKQISKVKPPRIYLASDGGRNTQEQENVCHLRESIMQHITWECEIYTRFLEFNAGCKIAVSSAISWFFSHEKQGIILEDDCLPSISFFRFCDELLERYKDEEQVFMISGWSALDFAKNLSVETLCPKARLQEEYFFSKYPHIWGWASWARAWQHYELELKNFTSEFDKLRFYSTKEKRYWHGIFTMYASGKIDTWDYPLVYSMWKYQGVSIYPKNNMITNIGFNRNDATHTTGDSKFASMPRYELAFPLKHPSKVGIHDEFDRLNFCIVFGWMPFHRRILSKMRALLARILG